jgi:hypothetical protein
MEPHTEGSVCRRNIGTKWTKTIRTRNIREDVNKRTRIDNDSESSEELYQCEMTKKKKKKKKNYINASQRELEFEVDTLLTR